MKYHKLYISFVLLFSIGLGKLKAQTNQFTAQYFTNKYLINPSNAGINDGLNINLNYQRMLGDIPQSLSVKSFTAAYRTKKNGLGINISSDDIALFKRTRAVATYAYHLLLNQENQHLSFGLSAGVVTQKLNNQDIIGDPSDVVIQNFNEEKSAFEGDFGVTFTRKNLTLQGSIPSFNSILTTKPNGWDRPYVYFSVAYKVAIAGNSVDFLNVEPQIAYRTLKAYSNIFDAGFNVDFKKQVNLMALYHSTGNSSFGFGYTYNKVSLNLFYDTPSSSFSGNINGNFELGVKVSLL